MSKALPTRSKISLLSPFTIITFVTLTFLVVTFFSGAIIKFYASFLFYFYYLIRRMWLAVVALGVFQTIIMIPFRIITMKLSVDIRKFEEEVEKEKSGSRQQFLIKRHVETGDPNMLWYLINFFVQTISYLSVGRLFLTDFYRKALDPKLLYSFVPYPSYPIRDTFFKIPYPYVTKSIDLGLKWLLIVWLVGLALKIFKTIFIRFSKKRGQDPLVASTGYFSIFLIASWVLIRYCPVGWEIRIFSGDVSIPNPTLNSITALGATLVVLWLNIPKITKKVQLAVAAKIPRKIIKKTQSDMFKEIIRNAVVVGLGAYFITRLIPSAFELSVFTLETISFLAPFTIDKLILRGKSA